jgi:hypothetical protein
MDSQTGSQIASFCSQHGLVFEDAPTLAITLHTTLARSLALGEKSQGLQAPDSASGVITRFAEESQYGEMTMAEQVNWKVVQVPDVTDDEIKQGQAEWKKADPSFDKDRFLTSISRNGYRLLGVKAREGVRDEAGNFKTVKGKDGEPTKVYTDTFRYIFIPGYVGGTVDQFVAWFAKRIHGAVNQETMTSAFTTFKKKAIDAELITLRSQMKAKKKGGGRGGDVAF